MHSATRGMIISLMCCGCCLAVLLAGSLWPAKLYASGPSVLERIEAAGPPEIKGEDQIVIPDKPKGTVLSRERYQGGSFRVLARKESITRYPCSSCHIEGKEIAPQARQLTHGEIRLNHGQAGVLACIDCHHPTDRNSLEDKKGNKIDLDHAYQLCGQCHFRQKSDWLGGAHGKRDHYWAGERVIYNCTTCHNPHSPRFESRFPATYAPTIEQRSQLWPVEIPSKP